MNKVGANIPYKGILGRMLGGAKSVVATKNPDTLRKLVQNNASNYSEGILPLKQIKLEGQMNNPAYKGFSGEVPLDIQGKSWQPYAFINPTGGRQTIAHELFHARGLPGSNSEALAHFYGGYKGPKGAGFIDRLRNGLSEVGRYATPETFQQYNDGGEWKRKILAMIGKFGAPYNKHS